LNIKAVKTPQHFNASLFVTIWVAAIGSFLTIDARMGRVMKRGVLQNTGPCLQAHYSFLGPARGLWRNQVSHSISVLTTMILHVRGFQSRNYVIAKGSCQPNDLTFPKNSSGRKFPPAWYKKYLDGSNTLGSSSLKTDKAFCFYCRTFNRQVR
jgi:hypothetical protein